MNKIAITLALLLFASVAYAGDMKPTEGETMEQATIVVYRNDADIRSRRLSFDVVMGAEDLGRMRDDVIVSHVDAGTYELQTSLPGSRPARFQPVERCKDRGLLSRAGWFQHLTGGTGIGDDRHLILGSEFR